jgi:hypothetical protein
MSEGIGVQLDESAATESYLNSRKFEVAIEDKLWAS